MLLHIKDHYTDSFFPASLIFSTLVSENPLILRSLLVGVEIRLYYQVNNGRNQTIYCETDCDGVNIIGFEFSNITCSNTLLH